MDIKLLIGIEVEHIIFHKGIVVDTEGTASDGYITVKFDDNNKIMKLVYPDAFTKYLKTEQYQNEIDKDIKNKTEAQKLAEEELAQKKLAEEERKRKAIYTKTTKNKGVTKSGKPVEGHNIAFKCTFCDGGSDETHIGFNGLCSDEIRDYNRAVAKTSWCSHPLCPCVKYVNGELSYSQLQEIYEGGTFVCYESLMLKNWKAYAGTDLSGDVTFKKRNISKLHIDNVAILTTREPGSSEQDRIIFAIYIVAGGYFGDEQNEGFVKAHDKYRLSFTKNEARTLKFWNYYNNRSNPDIAKWGTGLYRYLDNHQVKGLLEDVIKLKEGTTDESLAKELYAYFLSKNKIIDEGKA